MAVYCNVAGLMCVVMQLFFVYCSTVLMFVLMTITDALEKQYKDGWDIRTLKRKANQKCRDTKPEV